MNRDHLREVRDRIAADPQHFDMGCWVTYNIEEDGCGTTACIAGHAYLLATTADERHLADAANDRVKRVACRYLGLTSAQAGGLFFQSMWPQRFKNNPTREAEAKAAVALIDALLDGEVELNRRRGVWTDHFFGDVA